MVHIGAVLAGDWHRLDERIEAVSAEIEELAHAEDAKLRASHARRNRSPSI